MGNTMVELIARLDGVTYANTSDENAEGMETRLLVEVDSPNTDAACITITGESTNVSIETSLVDLEDAIAKLKALPNGSRKK